MDKYESQFWIRKYISKLFILKKKKRDVIKNTSRIEKSKNYLQIQN